MEYLIVAALAFFVGWKISEILHVVSFKKILEDLGVNEDRLKKLAEKINKDEDQVEAKDQPEKTVINIKVEEVEGMLMAFELDQQQFIAQGKTSDELLERIMDRYPTNVRVVCDVNDGGNLITEAVNNLIKSSSR